jgi:hypothetical protein
VWTTLSAGSTLCADTLALSCTETLDAGAASVPRRFALHAAYPNPASSTAVFRVDIPVESEVAVDLYDARGRLVRTVASGRMTAASRELSVDASRLDNGMYFLVLRAGRFTGWSAMTVLH